MAHPLPKQSNETDQAYLERIKREEHLEEHHDPTPDEKPKRKAGRRSKSSER